MRIIPDRIDRTFFRINQSHAVPIGHALVLPVYVNVIASNYEHMAGASSPRTTADVRTDVLEAAVVAAYNARYDAALRLCDLALIP